MEVFAGFFETIVKTFDALFELAVRLYETPRLGGPRLGFARIEFTPSAFDEFLPSAARSPGSRNPCLRASLRVFEGRG